MKKEKEVWRQGGLLPQGYRISSWGRIKSLERDVIRGNGTIHIKEKLLTPSPDPQTGSTHVVVSRDGIPKTFWVARLVAEAFIGDPSGKIVKHLNGDNGDDYYKNLELVSSSKSAEMDYLSERQKGHLNPHEVKTIRDLASSGIPRKEIAKYFSTSLSTITGIINHRLYKWVKDK